MIRRLFAVSLLAPFVAAACVDRETAQRAFAVRADGEGVGGGRLEQLPVARNREIPFRYPASLYANKIQGNVTLRLFIDSLGAVRPESTRVEESSGYAALDSAAVKGSEQLSFAPAQMRGRPTGVSILLPVFFRHPEAAALPGDTVLNSRQEGTGNGQQGKPW